MIVTAIEGERPFDPSVIDEVGRIIKEPRFRPEWDSALYLLTAQSLAEGDGYRYLGEAFFLRPPGFSYALTFFYKDGACRPESSRRGP